MTHRRKAVAKKIVTEQRVVVGVEDMVLLQDVREVGIMDNLRNRLQAEQIYTYIGHVLVVCNPYKWLPIYENAVMRSYVHQSRIDVPPHIFATAEAAYRSMVTEEESQCVIISGESGAGKTEASKQIQAYIAAISGDGEGVDKIKRIFLESNPVLEAFGNAKTLRNNNSSRFGKYFELKFNRFGTPQGGVITNYLLEKSRIIHAGQGERSFHIFYQLLRSKHTEALMLKGKSCQDFTYMSHTGCYDVDGLNDAEEFEVTIAAMRAVGMGSKQIQAILSLVSAILHLGNVSFRAKEISSAEGCELTGGAALQIFCDLVHMDASVIRHVLCYRELQTMAAGGKIDTYQVPQNPVQAANRRDAVAKSLYERLFDMIVNRINVALDPDKAQTEHTADALSIGVLDIYGFEVFDNNGFEQLCINYVNEKLQQIFIELTLRAEQDEYAREGIEWTAIPFFNNRVVCELLDGARPPGLFRVLDDTCKTLHGARDAAMIDKKFIETAVQVHGSHAHFSQSMHKIFTVKHYAGDVVYTAGMFGESNKDALNKDLVAALKQSGDRLVQFLYPEEIDDDDKKAPPTAGTRIRTQCQSLVTALMECSPHYVRCIKSNDLKKALNINPDRVKHQIKYLGLVENIKVRRAGFAYRAEYHRFLERFNILSPATYPDWRGGDKDGCKQIIKSINAQNKLPALAVKGEVQLGTSKIFIRQPETYFDLERLREAQLGEFVIRIQKAWRYYHHSKEYVQKQRSMAKLFAEQKKSRRSDSIYRPYQGDYLDALADSTSIRDRIFHIIDQYSDKENIVFADPLCGQLVSAATDPARWRVEPRIVILTTEALYLFDNRAPPTTASSDPGKSIPRIHLRRRISLHEGQGLDGVFLSKFADPCVGLMVNGPSGLGQAAANKSHWVPDEKSKQCSITGKPFSMFTRRHHCRACGRVCCDEACNYRAPVPDFGWISFDRICDDCIGTFSTDPLEDLLLICPRRSEFVCLLRAQFDDINVKAVKVHNDSFGARKQPVGSSKLPLNFGTTFQMRPCMVPSLATRPADNIVFSESPAPPRKKAAGGQHGKSGRHSGASVAVADAYNPDTLLEFGIIKIEFSGGGGGSFNAAAAGSVELSIVASAGLPHDLVEERRRRQAQRQKREEARRRAEEEQRRHRAALKLAEREAERLERLKEKKARKARERETKRVEIEQKEAILASKRGNAPDRRKFGGHKDTPVSESTGAVNAQKIAGAVPVGGKGGAGDELAAAMARRRAAVNGDS